MLALEEQWQQHLLSDLAAGDSAAVQADQNMLTYLKTGFVDPAKKEFDDLTQKAAAWANLPTPQMHNLTVQIDEAKVHSDELTASFAKANEPVIEASNDWTAVKAKIEEARLPAEQYLAVLQQQASAIQDQITYSQDLLAVQGQTGKTDAWLMQLQIARDQLQIAQQTAQSWGQATPALDKQLQLIGAAIGAEQARNQLAQDQTNLGNVGLQQQDAANKLAQDGAKIQLDGSAGALLNANQHIQASQAALTTAKAIQTVETQADDFHTKQLQSQLQILNDQKKVVVDMAAAAQGATAFPGLGGSGGTPNKISIPDYLPKPADAAAAAKPVGDAIVQGIAQGITQSIPAVQEAARAAVDAAILAARAEGQISSPSKRAAMEIGLPIAQGAALGVTSGASLVQDAMGSLMNMGPGGSAGWGGGGGSPAGESSGGGGTSIGHLLHVENMSVRNDSDITTLVQKISQAQYAVTQGRDTSLGYAQRNI
jgi:hypothetical protein